MTEPIWTKDANANRYRATINGRQFILSHNRVTRSHTYSPSWVCIGRKPRRTTSTTWYNVTEKVGENYFDLTHQNAIPGTLVQAKALAQQLAHQERKS